jgi:transposase
MSTPLTITTERVDDVPLLLAQMSQMGLPGLLDQHFPTNGNWEGLSLGWVTSIWLAHILTQATHRLSHAQPWVAQLQETLAVCTGQAVRPLDLSDDRLALVLRRVSQADDWRAFEASLTQHLVRVYDLPTDDVRLDATSSSGYWAVTEDGLFQYGHSKDHRPDLPQFKVMLAALDPWGMPLSVSVVSGEHADDPLYRPAIEQVRAMLGVRGKLYIGDAKMAALETRALLHAGRDYYLCPLPAVQMPHEQVVALVQPIWDKLQRVTLIERVGADAERRTIALATEVTVPITATVDGQDVTWQERRLVVRSLTQAAAQEKSLRARMVAARTAMTALMERRRGKHVPATAEEAQTAVEALLARHRVVGLFQVTITVDEQVRPVRRRGTQAAHTQVIRSVNVAVTEDAAATAAAIRHLGWRVYVTNAPLARLSLRAAVVAYREEYVIERDFARFKGAPLSLRPVYLHRADHVTGLVQLLSVALRVLILVEGVTRRGLAAQGDTLTGLYQGSPKHTTARPTAERLLAAFDGITLTVVHLPDGVVRHLPALSPLQRRIVALLGLPPDLYAALTAPLAEPVPKRTET